MTSKKVLLSCALLAFSCSVPTDSIPGAEDTLGTPEDTSENTSQTGSSASGSQVEDHILTFDSDAPLLETYSVSFWAVRGDDRRVRVHDTDGMHEFLRIRARDDALVNRVDGTPIAMGDSILITAAIDLERLLIRFEPAGLVFNASEPLEVRMWYAHADPDFNRDGVVNQLDGDIEMNSLGIWYQDGPGLPWEFQVSEHDLEDKKFKSDIRHFSNFVVSW